LSCDFCAGPGRPGHRYGSLLCQRGAHALRRGLLTWSHANIVDCRLVCPECGRRHDTFHAFESCLASHGVTIAWGIPKTRNGALYRRGPGAAYLHAVGHKASVDRAALAQRFLGDGQVLRRRKAQPERVCREDGLDVADGLDLTEVEGWLAWANRHVKRAEGSRQRAEGGGQRDLRPRAGLALRRAAGEEPWATL
jgi:hypothetical protein